MHSVPNCIVVEPYCCNTIVRSPALLCNNSRTDIEIATCCQQGKGEVLIAEDRSRSPDVIGNRLILVDRYCVTVKPWNACLVSPVSPIAYSKAVRSSTGEAWIDKDTSVVIIISWSSTSLPLYLLYSSFNSRRRHNEALWDHPGRKRRAFFMSRWSYTPAATSCPHPHSHLPPTHLNTLLPHCWELAGRIL
jgi:hypothetical protein